jgi:hypothetical protein
MLEILTAVGLALAAGLNAYIPLIAVSLLSKFTDFFTLPGNWSWMEDNWTLAILIALALVEFFADKIAAVDSLNDVIQTAIRPTSGGLLFAAGTHVTDVPVTQISNFVHSPGFPMFIIGLAIALLPHLMKMFIRPLINATMSGMVTPIVSFGENILTVGLVAMAIFIPVLVPVAVILVIVVGVRIFRNLTAKKSKTATA